MLGNQDNLLKLRYGLALFGLMFGKGNILGPLAIILCALCWDRITILIMGTVVLAIKFSAPCSLYGYHYDPWVLDSYGPLGACVAVWLAVYFLQPYVRRLLVKEEVAVAEKAEDAKKT
jgi:hypothetical protein